MCPNRSRRYRQGQTIIEWLISLLLEIYFVDLVVLERLLVMVGLILLNLISRVYLRNMQFTIASRPRISPKQMAKYKSVTRRDREVVDFTRSRVKNNIEFTNFRN